MAPPMKIPVKRNDLEKIVFYAMIFHALTRLFHYYLFGNTPDSVT